MKYKEKEKPVELFMSGIDTDEYLSVVSLKRAVWQYLIDHSKPFGRGMIKFLFIMPSEEEFWKRVWARDVGRFKRTDLFEFQQEMRAEEQKVNQAFKDQRKYHFEKEKNRQWDARIKKAEERGTPLEKIQVKTARVFKRWGRKLTEKAVLSSLHKRL